MDERHERQAAAADHATDIYAHNDSWERMRRPYIDAADSILRGMVEKQGHQLSDLQKFRERVTGGSFVILALVTGGILSLIAHAFKIT